MQEGQGGRDMQDGRDARAKQGVQDARAEQGEPDGVVSPRRGAYGLHVLVARLDRSAERILRAELDLTYSRYLLLLALHRVGAVTQRQLADELGLSEPAVSRALTPLVDGGLLTVEAVSGQGHRRRVALTDAGTALVERASRRLEVAFASLLAGASVAAEDLDRMTARLIDALDGGPPSG